MSATQYPYISLKPETSIRLFCVQPELSNGYVSCTLKQFDGKEFGDMVSDGKKCDSPDCDGENCYGTICHGKVPPYSALSYVWGDSSHTRKIYLGDYLIGVHETLWEFLHQMQTDQNAKTWFWTDYLCLNQADQTEMGEQVQRMGEIYSEAKETLAWLGRNGSPVATRVEDSTPVTNLEHQLELIAERVALRREAVEGFFAGVPNWTTMRRYRSSPIGGGSSLGLLQASTAVVQLGHGQLWAQNALQDVLSLPYWTRVWIVQEVARARAVKLAFGSVSINFDDFLLAWKSHAYYKLMKMGAKAEETTIGAKAAIEARTAVTEESLSMDQILKWSMLCQASRPVDRIYGLMGLIRAHGSETSSDFESFTVDYNKDITSVFWEIVFSCRILTVAYERVAEDEREVFLQYERKQFVDSVPLFADSLGCSQAFSPQGLCCYSETDQNPSLRRMARLTSRMVHVLRQVGIGLYALPIRDQSASNWRPTRESAHKCRPDNGLEGFMARFGLEIAALFLESAEFDDVGESGEIHAACIASKLAEKATSRGEWTCKPVHNHSEDDRPVVLQDDRMRRIKYDISWKNHILARRSGRPVRCSLLDLPTSPEHPEKHQCSGSSLFLYLPDPGFSLKMDLDPSDSTVATLNITVNGRRQ